MPSFSVDVSVEKSKNTAPSKVTVKFTDAYGHEQSSDQNVDTVSTAAVSQAVGKAMKLFADRGAGFVKLDEEKAADKKEPDGYAGDVPESEKDGKITKDGKVDEKKPEPAKPAPAKTDAGDKAPPAPAKK